MAEPLTVSDATFDTQVIKSEVPVLVDFWAGWCQPCLMLAPVVEELAQEYGPRIRLAKLDVDANPNIAGKFGVMSIPTLILFKDGEPARRMVGARGKGQLVEELEAFL